MCGGAAGRDGASSGVRGGSCRRAALAARRLLRSALARRKYLPAVLVARQAGLGTGADFSEMFPMDFRHLGTGAAILNSDTMVSMAMKRDWAQTACFDEMFSLLSKENWIFSCKKRCCAQNGNRQGEQFLRKLCLCPKMMEMEKIHCI